jgi:predicted RNA-binding Zn-ribbon protein involved in translation (DUF1610 family)
MARITAKYYNDLRQKEIKEIISKENEVYFCPFCHIVFREQDCKKIKDKYICLDCENTKIGSGLFAFDTYINTNRRGKRFHINGNDNEDTVNAFILQRLKPLKEKGFSNIDIQQISFFPISRINKIFKNHGRVRD